METKVRKEDRRTRYTREMIKNTTLAMLEKKEFSKISVTQLCKQVEINRGTFYLHYYDMEDVLDDILSDVVADTTGIMDHVFHTGTGCKDCSYPFCEKIHNDNKYRTLFLDGAIVPKILKKISDVYKEEYITWLMSHSLLTFEEAEAIFYFQMNGCIAINKQSLENNCQDWRGLQSTVDRFIKAGLEAFLIHDQRDEVLGIKRHF